MDTLMFKNPIRKTLVIAVGSSTWTLGLASFQKQESTDGSETA